LVRSVASAEKAPNPIPSTSIVPMQREADNGADCKPQKHRDQKADAVTCDGLTGRGLLDRPVDRIECSVEREQHDEQERDKSREVSARADNVVS
jgi:hypothetical protein